MSSITKIVGERLRNYRLQAKYSQETLAEKSGVHPTYIGQVERGEKNPTIESVEKIAKALDLPLELLFINIIDIKNLNSDIASECYDLMLSQPVNKQKDLIEIIKRIIKYAQ